MRRLHLLPAACVLLASCAMPHFYERQTLVLEGPGLDKFQVHYDEPGDCLWKQRWPSGYEIDRGPYRLTLSAPILYLDDPPVLDLVLRGEGAPRAIVTGAEAVENPLASGERRYQLRPKNTHGALHIAVQRDGRDIGAEELAFRAEQCKALLWRAPDS